MKTLKQSYSIITGIIILVFSMISAPTTDACFSVKPKDTNVNITLPIAELQGLIQQLQDAGSQVVGEAGVQIRQSIDQLNSEMEQRINQIQNAGSELIAEASEEISSIINNLVSKANELLKEVNKMIQSDIQCIDFVLAQRIQQITDAAYSILDKVDTTIKSAVDRIYIRATMLVDTSTQRMAVVIDNTFKIIAKIVIFIFCFLLLFWLIRMLWKSSFPKAKILAIGIPVIIVLLVGAGTYLILSKTALARMFGTEIPIPKWEESCNKGNDFYASFISMKNEGKTIDQLKPIGNTALEELNWCLYASVSPEATTDTYDKINTIKVILYPPIEPPSAGGVVVPGSPCGNNGTGGSINPGWLSDHNFSAVEKWEKLRASGIIRTSNVVTPAIYKERVNRVNPSIVFKTEVASISNYKQPTEINGSKIKDKTYQRNARMR